MGDRRIYANMDGDAIWQRMQRDVWGIMKPYTTGAQMEEAFTDVIRHAKRIICDVCGANGVSPHDCVCAMYCFMCKTGYFMVPQFQVMLAALVKAEMEIMLDEQTKAHLAKSRQLVVVKPQAVARVVVGGGSAQSVVVNNHNHHYSAKDAKGLEELEKKVDELYRMFSGQFGQKAAPPPPSAPEPTGGDGDFLLNVLRKLGTVDLREG